MNATIKPILAELEKVHTIYREMKMACFAKMAMHGEVDTKLHCKYTKEGRISFGVAVV
jgi:hypothetical protein